MALNVASSLNSDLSLNYLNYAYNGQDYPWVPITTIVSPASLAGTGGAISEFSISGVPISGSESVPVVSSSGLKPFPWMLTTGNMQDMTGGMRN